MGPGGSLKLKKRSHSARSINSARSKNRRSQMEDERNYTSDGPVGGVSSILGGSRMRSKSPMQNSAKRRSRSNSITSSRKALLAKNDKLNASSPFQIRKRKMLVNIGNIQVNTSQDRSASFQNSQGPQFNSIGYKHSLNYSMRKREQAK